MAEPPPLDPDQVARIAKAVSDIYGDATARMLELVAKRMARGIDDPGWAEAKLLDLIGLRADAQAVVADLATTGPPAVRKAIEDAAEAGRTGAARQLGISLSPSINTDAVDALATETVARLRPMGDGILRGVNDIYRQVVAEVSAPGVVTGTETRIQATQRALNRWADHGITGFVDKAGRNWEIETYAEMATRTASGRAMIDARTETYLADGRSFVIVSNSPQECGLCRPFEGKGLSLDGTGVGTKVGGIPIVATLRQARHEGLMHPHCRHDLRPIIPGLTRPFTGTEDPAGDAARQEQRRLERQVRKWRKRQAVALDSGASKDARRRAMDAQRRLNDHIKAHDLKQISGRTSPRLGGATPTPTTSGIRSRIPRDSAHGRQVTSGLDAMQKVHDIPPAMRGTTIVDGTKLPQGKYGWFRPGTRTMAISPGVQAPLTTVHEMGHAMSFRVFGGRGSVLPSHPHLRNAIEQTSEVRLLRSQRLTETNAKRIAALDYMLSDEELWARSYSQWVALKSGAPEMMKALNVRRSMHWADSDFGPIAQAVESVLRSKGLLP